MLFVNSVYKDEALVKFNIHKKLSHNKSLKFEILKRIREERSTIQHISKKYA